MLQKCSLWRVASVFFKKPTTSHYQAQLSRETGLAHTSIAIHLRTLENHNIIYRYNKQKNSRHFPYYKANRESQEYKRYKRIYNHATILESGLVEELRRHFAPSVIILFGSYHQGEDTEQSDIDIFLQAEPDTITLTRYENSLGRNIQLHIKESIQKYPKQLRENITNGTVVEGRLV